MNVGCITKMKEIELVNEQCGVKEDPLKSVKKKTLGPPSFFLIYRISLIPF